MMLPSRSVRNRLSSLSRSARARPFAGPGGDAPPALALLSDVTAMLVTAAYRAGTTPGAFYHPFWTPGVVPVPSYGLLVLLYGRTVVLSRNFRPVSTSAIPLSPCDTL